MQKRRAKMLMMILKPNKNITNSSKTLKTMLSLIKNPPNQNPQNSKTSSKTNPNNKIKTSTLIPSYKTNKTFNSPS